MNFLSWILFGALIGIISNIIDPQPSGGRFLGAVILGILGAIAGGFLGNIVFGFDISGFNFPSLSVAVLSALALLYISRIAGKAER